MKRLPLIIAALMLLASCGNKNKITIEGTLDNGANKVIYIEEMTPDSRLFIDSITLDKNGHFIIFLIIKLQFHIYLPTYDNSLFASKYTSYNGIVKIFLSLS